MEDKWKAAMRDVLKRKLRAPMLFPGAQPSMNLQVLPTGKLSEPYLFRLLYMGKVDYNPPLLINLIFRTFPCT